MERSIRPDMALVLETTRQVVLLEFTVPWEDQMEEDFKSKRGKSEGLQTRGWRAQWESIEVE